jgi:dienelactone hydrolase
VTVPNLYDEGIVFDEYDEASKYVESIGGVPVLLERTQEAARFLPDEIVYAGFSNGGLSAEYLAAVRPGAIAAILVAAGIPLEMFGEIEGSAVDAWPADVPVQVHYTKDDPFRDEPAMIDRFAESVRASGSPYEFHEYPGAGHLFTDKTLSREYDAGSTALLWERVEGFLARIGR